MRAYLANGLFSTADQMFNKHLATEIRKALPFLELYVPQENEALNDKTGYADSITIFNGDNHYLDDSDILIAILDGIEIDSGVSAEIGRFAMKKELEEHVANVNDRPVTRPRFIYGLYTDVRQHGTENERKVQALKDDPIETQFLYRNLYTVGAIKKHGAILRSVEQLVDELRYNHG